MTSTPSLLSVRDLTVSIGKREIVHGVSFDVEPGATLGIVGESGSGKSLTVLAATGLLDAPASKVSGSSQLTVDGRETELVGARASQLRSVHGSSIGFVFQDPSTSLNPLLTLGRQITESLEAHRNMTAKQARARALELLEAVGIPQPDSRINSYPHQLSGGQRQRVMIAIALACDPVLLIADEPTTALDVTTQAQIIELVAELQRERGTAVVWISHDLGVIGQVADNVAVMKEGEIVEARPIVELIDDPSHAYTKRLLDARPVLGRHQPVPVADDARILLAVDGLDVRFPVTTPTGRDIVHAVNDVSFEVKQGHTLGIVGESGSGKSTIANALTGLVAPTAGRAELDGDDVLSIRGKKGRALRRQLAMVFQDPFSSLDPRNRIGEAIAEPIKVHRLASDRTARDQRIGELLDLVELPRTFAQRYPHELSGGQRQRVSIARALALEPKVIILDESTASLDVSIQAKVLELLQRLQTELGLTYMFIAHDLAIVQQMSHDVLVLKAGHVMEYRPAAELFDDPESDYTKELLAAIPPARPPSARQRS